MQEQYVYLCDCERLLIDRKVFPPRGRRGFYSKAIANMHSLVIFLPCILKKDQIQKSRSSWGLVEMGRSGQDDKFELDAR